MRVSLLCVLLAVSLISCGGGVWGGNEGQPPTNGTTYGPELQVSGDWIIDNETVVVTSEQPIYFAQDYHEQN